MLEGRVIRNLVLIGFMGVGKSTVAQSVAVQLGFEYLDTDAAIEATLGKPIARIFAEDGEARFRACESALVADLTRRTRLVVATGGGVAANAEHLASLKTHALVACLWASAETIWERVRTQSHRPLLQTPDPLGRIRALLAERAPFYRQADLLVNTEMRSAKEVANQVLLQFRAVCQGEPK
jgi:shikimate kinase